MSGQINSLKELLHTVTELLFVRFKMARIEFVAQKERMVQLGMLAALAVMLFFMSYISLLFGLSLVLSDPIRIWVFFGLAAGLLLLMCWAGWAIHRNLASQRRFLAQTLNELQEDIAFIQGKKGMSDLSLKE
ncbi:phage holin family protein [Zobellella maritima]|uniref:phage holin family protein n=1 Tax=Zobellella maritima TaxID=2059725 RepID=UPI000E303AB8|nr:phage holin family protein [Zobellella maritima]